MPKVCEASQWLHIDVYILYLETHRNPTGYSLQLGWCRFVSPEVSVSNPRETDES